MSLDIKEIIQALIIMLSGSAIQWVFSKTLRNSKDLNALYRKLRDKGVIDEK